MSDKIQQLIEEMGNFSPIYFQSAGYQSIDSDSTWTKISEFTLSPGTTGILQRLKLICSLLTAIPSVQFRMKINQRYPEQLKSIYLTSGSEERELSISQLVRENDIISIWVNNSSGSTISVHTECEGVYID